MTSIEDRYCDCIFHVASKSPGYNPYAVCTRSVYANATRFTSYGTTSRTGAVKCGPRYKFEKFKTDELRAYAKKKIEGAESMSRKELIDSLYKYIAKEKGMEVWQEFLKRYVIEHPRTPYKVAKKKASEEYRKAKFLLLSR